MALSGDHPGRLVAYLLTAGVGPTVLTAYLANVFLAPPKPEEKPHSTPSADPSQRGGVEGPLLAEYEKTTAALKRAVRWKS
jgi:hypothetical protein